MVPTLLDRKGNVLIEGDYMIHFRDSSDALWKLTKVTKERFRTVTEYRCDLHSFTAKEDNVLLPKSTHCDIPYVITKESFIKYPPNLPKTPQSIRAYGLLCGIEWWD